MLTEERGSCWSPVREQAPGVGTSVVVEGQLLMGTLIAGKEASKVRGCGHW